MHSACTAATPLTRLVRLSPVRTSRRRRRHVIPHRNDKWRVFNRI